MAAEGGSGIDEDISLEEVKLGSPVEIVPGLTEKHLPELPPRDNPATVKPRIPPQLPPRDTIAAPGLNPHSVASSRLPSARQTSIGPSERLMQQRSELNKSLLLNNNAYFLIYNHLKLIESFKQFIKDQDIYKEDQRSVSEEVLSNDDTIDKEFWRVLLFNYEDIQYTMDVTIYKKIDTEFQNLTNSNLRHQVYLGLTNSVYIDDELFHSVVVELSPEQQKYVSSLILEPGLTLTVSKLITINDKIPNPVIIELGKVISKFENLKPDDVFKILIYFQYEFEQKLSDDAKSNSRFLFQISRALEESCPRFLFALTEALGASVYSYIYDLLQSSKFWSSLFTALESSSSIVKFCDSLVLKGIEVFITTIVKLVFKQEDQMIHLLKTKGKQALMEFVESTQFMEPLTQQAFYQTIVSIRLYSYEKEYDTIMTSDRPMYSKKSNDKLERAMINNRELIELKSKLQAEHTQILSNYQQLNEEKFTNGTYIKSLIAKKSELGKNYRELKQQHEMKSSNLQILKANNERNEQFEAMNDDLGAQITKLNEDIEILQEKYEQLKELKGKKKS